MENEGNSAIKRSVELRQPNRRTRKLRGEFFHELRISGLALIEVFARIEFGLLSVIELACWTVVAHDAGIDFALSALNFLAVRVEEGFVHG